MRARSGSAALKGSGMVERARLRFCVGLLGLSLALGAHAAEYTKPKVRAITAFVRLEPATWEQEIGSTLAMLHEAQKAFERQGYAVESVRITTQPLAELVQGRSDADALAFLKALNDLADKQSFLPNVGPAMLKDSDDPRAMQLLAKALSSLPQINASAIMAGDDGIHWKVIRESAKLVRYVADHSPHSQGTFGFAATAMLAPYGPFYPGSYHLGAGRELAIGFEGANVVKEVFARSHGDFDTAVAELTRELTIHARVAETIGTQVAAHNGWTFMGVDPTPAPLGDVSIAAAMEAFTGDKFGASGTMTAALAITTAVKAVPVKRIGYSGLMLPVMEDKLLAQRWAEGTYTTDALLAYSAVCGTGVDTVPLPGDVSEDHLVRIFGDVAALAWKWHKPLSARLQPVTGSKSGDMTAFDDPYLFNTKIH
jgi:uncharacterized protein